MKRLLSLVLTLAMVVGLLPATLSQTAEAASEAGRFFSFPSEQYLKQDARVVNTERVTLNGSLNNVSGSSISYSVYQLPKTGTTPINSREGQTGNIQLNGSSISIFNVQLFPGFNKITFKGQQGVTQVEDSIYLEYRNGPTLFDLSAILDGQTIPLSDLGSTVVSAVYGGATVGKKNVDIAISGKAPNAEKVTVTVNGKSWTYNVSSQNDYKFYASPVNIRQGNNIVTIRTYNNNQAVETTREITFYNGRVTFNDVVASDGTVESVDLTGNPEFSVSSNNITIKGHAIVPIAQGIAPDPKDFISYVIKGGATTPSGSVPFTLDNPVEPNDRYATISYTLPAEVLAYDKQYYVELSGWNRTLSPQKEEKATNMGFTLRDKNKAYIYEVNYLSGYNNKMSPDQVKSLSGPSMNGAKIFSVPFAAEVLVANSTSQSVTISKINDATDKTSYPTSGYTWKVRTDVSDTLIKNINGVQTTLERVFIEFSKLPVNGEQNIYFNIGGVEKRINATLLFGPYVQYDGVYDDMKISLDTTMDLPSRQNFVMTALKNLQGEILNITNDADLVYASGKTQSVFLYINNTLVGLGKRNGSNSQFELLATDKDKVYGAAGALVIGDNVIKLVIKTSSTSYESKMKVSIIPTNLPVIPVPNTDGIFPYSASYRDEPKPNDPNFQLKNSVYMTKEAKMNVFGTFDFIDLGTTPSEVQSSITSKAADLANYKVLIQSPGMKDIEWSLENEFLSWENKDFFNKVKPNDPKLTVYYNYTGQHFSFILNDQDIPEDGSPKVYTISVYNSGYGGPRATYRLEVNPISIPYTVLEPLTQKRVVNKNFVEVVIYSQGAEKITINKIEAKKINYDPDYDGKIDYAPAYRVLVTKLKAGKDNKIDIVITRGADQIKDSIYVKYVPTSIPGAQFMEGMKNSHKVFDGALNLSFAKGTTLLRRDYNTAEQYKNQVFSGHNLLFSVANSVDGVVDRHEFDRIPPNFDYALATGKQKFIGNFQERFVKSSPVYWIDPGLADDISTKEIYDPVTNGNDPYQFPGAPIKNFYERDPSRELTPSKPGTLTLNYDPNITGDAGRVVTVFRYDPELQQWENIGGVVDAKKHTIKVSFSRFGYYVVAKLGYSYNDTVQHPYGRDYIETIYAKGVMNAADPSSQFGADLYESRAEFSRMIVRALDLPLNYEGNKHFIDLPSTTQGINLDGLWDFRYVETAARAGIVRGAEPQVFDATGNILRQDAGVMIARALNLKLETDRAKVSKDLQKYFVDFASIDYYAQPSILAIAKKGFIAGSPIDPNDPKKGYTFKPKANILRGDASIIIAKVMADLKRLPKI